MLSDCYLICFVLCAQWPDTIMQICAERTCVLAVTSGEWEVGSQHILRSRMGYQQQKRR